MKEREIRIVKEILKLAEELGDKSTVVESDESLKITLDVDWRGGAPTSRPKT